MLSFYRYITNKSESVLERLLSARLEKGKEVSERINERKGIASLKRPEGSLFWVHGASVGEAQSALILVQRLIDQYPNIDVLITTGTKTSAEFLKTRLPARCIHQFYPLDHPDWVERFLDHWKPNAVFWMESELWPNMLMSLQKRNVASALVNARLSEKSFKLWSLIKGQANALLKGFDVILAQTQQSQERFKKLGLTHVLLSDNIKYSAKPLSYNDDDLKQLSAYIGQRPVWLYSSTHAGEEELACTTHEILKLTHPDILTIIVPRHPERGESILRMVKERGLRSRQRSLDTTMPEYDDDIYLADTLGELGLFYRLTPVACIGRSFSDDGGGGHNPIEAAQLNCGVLHGPHVQFQKELFDEMHQSNAAIEVSKKEQLSKVLLDLLPSSDRLQNLQEAGYHFAKTKTNVVESVMTDLKPVIDQGLKV